MMDISKKALTRPAAENMVWMDIDHSADPGLSPGHSNSHIDLLGKMQTVRLQK